jgi:hypothetical protein
MMPWPGYVREVSGSKGQILQNMGDLANFLLPVSSDAAGLAYVNWCRLGISAALPLFAFSLFAFSSSPFGGSW